MYKVNAPRSIFSKYVSPYNETSYYKEIPISMLDVFRGCARAAGVTYRIRYRGPRKHRGNKHQAQSYCLKQDATRFSVYAKDRRYDHRLQWYVR